MLQSLARLECGATVVSAVRTLPVKYPVGTPILVLDNGALYPGVVLGHSSGDGVYIKASYNNNSLVQVTLNNVFIDA